MKKLVNKNDSNRKDNGNKKFELNVNVNRSKANENVNSSANAVAANATHPQHEPTMCLDIWSLGMEINMGMYNMGMNKMDINVMGMAIGLGIHDPIYNTDWTIHILILVHIRGCQLIIMA